MGQQKFSLYPYQASYNNWIQVWEAGYVAEGVPETNPGKLGIIQPNMVNNTGDGIFFSKKFGWPTYLPFNCSRTIYLSSSSQAWSDYGTLYLTYQNYWGFYITETVQATGWDITGTIMGNAQADIGAPPDTTFMSCPKFFYPNRLIEFAITWDPGADLPDAPLYLDFGNQGMAEFQIQDSVRYGNSNFSLEVLTDAPGETPDFTTQYAILASNYPRFVMNNQEKISPPGPLVVDNFFLPYNSVNNTFANEPLPSGITSSVYWLCTEDFVIDGPLNANSFTNLPFDGGLLNVLIDIGNQRRNEGYTPEEPGPTNKANLLLSLIQNGITT